ncbi:hypothetical protein BaRGS_00001772 [Batillaria attramentaria]|uniref:Uncharacterized protein n=1 Tax=Batillaria attramentaria TaxID=370345 RepID=A0ABD0M583_9CAEN
MGVLAVTVLSLVSDRSADRRHLRSAPRGYHFRDVIERSFDIARAGHHCYDAILFRCGMGVAERLPTILFFNPVPNVITVPINSQTPRPCQKVSHIRAPDFYDDPTRHSPKRRHTLAESFGPGACSLPSSLYDDLLAERRRGETHSKKAEANLQITAVDNHPKDIR